MVQYTRLHETKSKCPLAGFCPLHPLFHLGRQSRLSHGSIPYVYPTLDLHRRGCHDDVFHNFKSLWFHADRIFALVAQCRGWAP